MSESAQQREPDRVDPDVLLDIPKVSVDTIRLAVDGLDADLSLRARVANLIQVDAGVRVRLSSGELDLDGVHAEAQLRVRLEQLTTILSRALDTLDHNPQIIEALARTAVSTLDDVHRRVPQSADRAVEASARRSDGVLDGTGAPAGGGGSAERPRPESGAMPERHPTSRRHGERHHPAGQRPAGGGEEQRPAGGGEGQRPSGTGRGTEGPAEPSTGQARNRPGPLPAVGPGPSGADDGGGGPLGGAQAAAQSAAQLAEQAGETLRQAGRSVWEAIQSGVAQHRQQGRDG
ncbi:hypothetical protein AB0B85_08320 [Micromonospora sp. NPDC049044]|uniref:hypothetical protein n=1 Tax=unclassified Micromonospora TaxID=2617518 RepID=UPI0033D3F1C8